MPSERERVVPVASASYSNLVGFIFIFNLIVGTGALTLPGVFAKAGWFLGLVVILLLAIMSYMTVTFIIEAMAGANAIKNWQNLQVRRRTRNSIGTSDDERDLESTPLIGSGAEESHYYQLTHKFELGEMASLFFNDFGRVLFYLCFIVYLFGDLSIYSTAVSRSLRDIICEHDRSNSSDISIVESKTMYQPGNFQSKGNHTCWKDHSISRIHMYRIILIAFNVIFGPIILCGIQKTKYLQMLTAIFRWLAFTFMICIATKLLITDGAKGHPVGVNFYGSPPLFGACVYSFMCHHSLPSLLAPLRNKSKVSKILSYDYIVICMFYIVLAMTGIFAFEHVEDLYTLNFLPDQENSKDFLSGLYVVIDYFLSLFPVFTLSTSFPVIAVTLKNNLQILFLDMSRYESYNLCIRALFPLMTILPSFCVAYLTDSLSTLVAFTGSYAGTGIQYIIPVCLLYFSRRTCTELLGSGIVNHFQSPFKSNGWLILVLIWSFICVVLVSINLFH
ncbi:transmembrane protein 104 homolog [Drosophila sulfurigaster albostrigata]|uniref:transmembrane protein 104 homolog n=1 Tax=Drosophila sulfurigaster albostrigata TaxID=89887 RepID=UPI002D219D56|nr:transmembrane protein 104 homolog [Drosophila sulfurigaster albostrigata]XP_062126018.1 transmembrane protein 104 homolog [Drosophila sulfurigaster albostrigata]